MVSEQTVSQFPFWNMLTEKEKRQVLSYVQERSFSMGSLLHSQEACMGMLLVLEGRIRVCILSEDGRKITLYYLDKGECCVFSAGCVLSELTFETTIEAASDTRVAVLPSAVLSQLEENNIGVECSLYKLATERMSTVLWVLQRILFSGFDSRLAAFLVQYAGETGKTELHMTQEAIASEVNSAREVVARMLRRFSEDGLVELERGKIRLTDLDGLRSLAQGAGKPE